ncbi:hypothetical protein WMF34_45090 [Sorangium sp. So ce145]|nr:hypothetical protein [Sorangium cellulosum]
MEQIDAEIAALAAIIRENHAMLEIWGRISSINVRKVAFTAQLLHLPFERVGAGAAFGIPKTPEYLARNPNALVPTLEGAAAMVELVRSVAAR